MFVFNDKEWRELYTLALQVAHERAVRLNTYATGTFPCLLKQRMLLVDPDHESTLDLPPKNFFSDEEKGVVAAAFYLSLIAMLDDSLQKLSVPAETLSKLKEYLGDPNTSLLHSDQPVN